MQTVDCGMKIHEYLVEDYNRETRNDRAGLQYTLPHPYLVDASIGRVWTSNDVGVVWRRPYLGTETERGRRFSPEEWSLERERTMVASSRSVK